MDVAGIVPVRMGSSRYPGKPLCDIQGMTMVEHVYRRTAMSEAIDETHVATPDEEIREEVESFGGDVIMTGEHTRATDRVAEAAHETDAEVIVVMQGD
jgi:3-deoxy-manno-octulosonate cytidylyltransferase (CMP-KDO synthetase)